MLESLNKKIEAPSVADHAKELHDRLAIVMLTFAEQKYLEAKKTNKAIKISDVIDENTDLFFQLENTLHYQRNFSEVELTLWKIRLKQKIDDIYAEGGDWMSNIENLFKEEEAEYKTTNETPAPKKYAGIINYNLRHGEHGLEEYGFDRNLDQALEIHLDELFKGDKKLSSREALNSLAKLAEVIVDEMPQTKVIIAESWLMDHPIFQKLGFQLTDKPSSHRMPNQWLQFVDKEGQLDQRRVSQLLESGEFPYNSRVAYFSVMDFLKKYLPAERRGKPIILKDLRSGFKANSEAVEADGKKFSAAWPKLSIEDIENFRNLFPILSSMLDKLELLDEFIEVLKRMKNRGDDWGEGRNKEINFFNKFQERRDKYIAENETISKEVIIE